MRFAAEIPMPAGAAPRVAVLLINLGTPSAPTPRAVRRYLAEFLSDPRVIEIPRPLWQLILRLAILPLRPRVVARKYAAVWLPEGSPLRVHTERQTAGLRQALAARGYEVVVDYAMRYGEPGLRAAVEQLKLAGVRRILLAPLYPQYSSSTTATAFDEVFRALLRMRWQPDIRTLAEYSEHPRYIDALATQVQDYWALHGRPDFAAGDRLVLSFHGLPRRTIELGDPYHAQCRASGERLMHALGLTEIECHITFQSRFGRAEWLQPYTAQTLAEFGAGGVGRVDVFCPGFPADCLETVEEIGIEGRDAYLAAGGKVFHRVPCVNDAPAWIAALAQIVDEQLQGWPLAPVVMPAPGLEG